MSSKKSGSRLSGEPAWVYSLLTGVLSFLLIFILGHIFLHFGLNEILGGIIILGLTGIAIAIACFFICRRFPKSLLYTILLCNIYGIYMAILVALGEKGDTSFWIPIILGWVLSIIGAISGRAMSKT